MPQSFNTIDYARQLQQSGAPLMVGTRDLSGPDRIVFARCSTGSGQTLVSTGNYTRLQYNTVNKDTHGIITTGASWAAVMPFSGVLTFAARLRVSASTAWAAGELGGLVITINTTRYWIDRDENVSSSASVLPYFTGDGQIDVSTNDTVYFEFYNGCGSDLTVGAGLPQNWMTLALSKAF